MPIHEEGKAKAELEKLEGELKALQPGTRAFALKELAVIKARQAVVLTLSTGTD